MKYFKFNINSRKKMEKDIHKKYKIYWAIYFIMPLFHSGKN